MATKVEQTLIDINNILGQFIPLVGLVGIGVRATVALLKQNNPALAKEFEIEIEKFDAQREALGAAIDEFYRKYPLPPEE